MKTFLAWAAAVSFCACLAMGSGPASAALVTPDVIFGSGNANGSFTVVQQDGIELGLRGKLRYNTSGLPENTFNYDGGNTYTFDPADGNPPAGRAMWNFDWSINSNFDGSSGRNLDDLLYLLTIDFDPGPGAVGFSFDPINLPLADHAIGTNATGNGGGTVAANGVQYASLIASNNVAQNSGNLGFFLAFAPPGFDPQSEGIFTIGLRAFDSHGSIFLENSINVIVGTASVPLPATLLLFAAALGALAITSRRRLRQAPI